MWTLRELRLLEEVKALIESENVEKLYRAHRLISERINEIYAEWQEEQKFWDMEALNDNPRY
jgi:hypothetical protein